MQLYELVTILVQPPKQAWIVSSLWIILRTLFIKHFMHVKYFNVLLVLVHCCYHYLLVVSVFHPIQTTFHSSNLISSHC